MYRDSDGDEQRSYHEQRLTAGARVWVQLDLVHDLATMVAMLEVNVHQAKTQFSKLLERVARGEEIIIAKAGRPVARLVPLESATPRAWGQDRGRVTIHADFYDCDAEVAALFNS